MLIIFSIMLLIAFVQVPSLIHKKQWGELAAFSVLWLLATVYASLVALDVYLPSPTDFVINLLDGG